MKQRDIRSNSQPLNIQLHRNTASSAASISQSPTPPLHPNPTNHQSTIGQLTPQTNVTTNAFGSPLRQGFHPHTHIGTSNVHYQQSQNPHHSNQHQPHAQGMSSNQQFSVHLTGPATHSNQQNVYLSPSFVPANPPFHHSPINHPSTSPLVNPTQSPNTPSNSLRNQPMPRLSMPPAVNYSDSYTFPPQSRSSPIRAMGSASSSPDSSSSVLNSAGISNDRSHSLPHTDLFLGSTPSLTSSQPNPSQILHSIVLTDASTNGALAESYRLGSLRPESLQIGRPIQSSILANLSHSVSLPMLPQPVAAGASANQSSNQPSLSQLFDLSLGHESMEYRDLDSAIGVLQNVMDENQSSTLTQDKLQKALKSVIDQLITVKSSSLLRSSNIHNALFQTLALRRSASESIADREVVDWISHEYLTPRRGSTSSDGGQPGLPHSQSHSSALSFNTHHAHSHSVAPYYQVPTNNQLEEAHQQNSHRSLSSKRSNSMTAGITLRSGSHPSLEQLPHSNISSSTNTPVPQPSTVLVSAARRHSHDDMALVKLLRATSFARIVKRLSAIATKRRLSACSTSGPALEEIVEEKSDSSGVTSSGSSPDDSVQDSPSNAVVQSSAPPSPPVTSLHVAAPALQKIDESCDSSSSKTSLPQTSRRDLPLVESVPTSRAHSHSVSQRPRASPPLRSSSFSRSRSLSADDHHTMHLSPSINSWSKSRHSLSQADSQSRRSDSRSSDSLSSHEKLTPTAENMPSYWALTQVLTDPVKTLLLQITDWEFDLFAFHSVCGPRTLSVLACHLFNELDLFDRFSIPRETFAMFINAIEDGYNMVPYHNSIHAADVMLNMYFILQTSTFSSVLTQYDMLASLVAAAAHDFQHPGTNNAYQIATQSDLAIRYNDSCVLENMHAAEAFFLLKKPQYDIFHSFLPAARSEIRATIIHEILATDMQQHFANLAQLRAQIEAKRAKREAFDYTLPTDRLILLANAIHCADLGNPCKPLHIYLEWTKRLMEEFYLQGDRESEAGLPVSLMMDRSKPNVERSQVGFMDVICQPLWQTVYEIAPQLNQPMAHLKINRQYWHAQMNTTKASSNADEAASTSKPE